MKTRAAGANLILEVLERVGKDMDNTVSVILRVLERDLTAEKEKVPEKEVVSGKEAILEVLGKAADDHKFLARLAEDPTAVLEKFNLTSEQKAALASGDLRRIESWVGKLDKRLSTWIWCRLQQEKW
jgi:aldehyde:ferredoxin oxidoreductase